MLEGLDRIDWDRVQHAYGPAREVPAWLREIAKEPKRGKAFTSFVNAVNHQGAATPAALVCVPFLLEILAAGAGPTAALTELLGDVAAGGDHTNVLAAMDDEREDPHRAALAKAVEEGRERFRDLMKHADANVRAAAALPLAMLPDPDGRTVKVLGAAVASEQKPEPLASYLLALAWLEWRERRRTKGKGRGGVLARLEAAADDDAVAVRVAATVGASWIDPSEARVRTLVSMVAKAPSQGNVPFGHGDLRALAVAEIAAQTIRGGDADAFLNLAIQKKLLGERELYGVVLAAVAPELARPPVEPPLASDFSDAQRRVLARLAKRVVEVSKKAHVPLDAFRARGIIDPVRMFGGAAPGLPLDEIVDGQPLWRHARRVRDGRADLATWRRAIERWSKGDVRKREALAVDCFANGHVLSMPYPDVDDESISEKWRSSAAWGAVLEATLEGLGPKIAAKLAGGSGRAADYAVAPLVRALGGKLDAATKKRVLRVVGSEVLEPSVGRAVLGALPPKTRDALAKACAFDILVENDGGAFRVVLRGAWQWLDLSPALVVRMCGEMARWTEIPEANDDPLREEKLVAEIVHMVGRAPGAAKAAKAALARAKPAGKRVLERIAG
ncbi:MAG: hypothetical protein JST00_39175 [Deltaproteobacteria bacterium]|nr:hypothetical protein [Deltaproteobacteria bacterium]